MRKTLFVALAALMLLASCGKESSEKKILTFKFATPEATVTISESAKTITAVVPEGTNVTALIPIFTLSPKATAAPVSGTTLDFTKPVTILVTAEDGSSVEYKVTVTFEQNGGGGGGGNGGGGGGGNNSTVNWSGNISQNTTWPDLGLDVDYVIEGWTYIEGNALLTIEPGVTIMFTGVDGGLDVGENAGLKMVGTAEKPIRLVNPLNNNNPGAWLGIRIHSTRLDNQFEYVEFINGGSDNNAVVSNEGKLSMKHCLINGGLGFGAELYNAGEFTAFENNTIKNVACPLVINEYEKVGILGNGNNYVNNSNNVIALDDYYMEGKSTVTFHNQGIPYQVTQGLNVYDNSKMTVDAGTEFVFEYETEFIVGDNCRLEVNGTASQPVVFKAKNAEDPWRGIEFRSYKSGNVINYAKIMDCGLYDSPGYRGCLLITSEAKLALTNNVFGPSNYYGVVIEQLPTWSSNVTHSGNTFTNCKFDNVFIETGGECNGQNYPDETYLDHLP